MAASSSAKFFVHQNQNKAANLNSSSAASAFAVDDSDVVEFIEFPFVEKYIRPSSTYLSSPSYSSVPTAVVAGEDFVSQQLSTYFYKNNKIQVDFNTGCCIVFEQQLRLSLNKVRRWNIIQCMANKKNNTAQILKQ
ncbi:hypothetical protein CVS40_12271 [Lucilia cuprina]|nr:hypothetical protein CVS40_12271 [Lucilia cuprina]